MKEITHPSTNVTKPLEKINFYRDVIALFMLSRKLKKSRTGKSFGYLEDHKADLMLAHFSERLQTLPMAIAEAEVTSNELKRIAIHLDIKSHIPELHSYWIQLKRQLSLPREWSRAGDRMIKSLPKNYGDWAQSLTCVN